jgi:hypothetical protein
MTEEPKVEVKPKHLPITNAQAESLLKCIPAGWHLVFSRPLLRPDLLDIKIVRHDDLAFTARTSGAALLDTKDNDFMEIIFHGVKTLMTAKRK